MQLLLMRHGEAVEQSQGLGDSGRWLCAEGRATTRRVGLWLAQNTQVSAVLTSPKIRAVQTAEIVAAALNLEDRITVHVEIANGDLRGLLQKISATRVASDEGGNGALLLVGHEPHLSELVERLLGAGRSGDWSGFRKSAVCALSWDRKTHATFAWVLCPADLSTSTTLGHKR